MDRLLSFLCSLENNKIHYTLEHNRGEAMMVLIAVPGERWEVEFFADDRVEIERFVSSGSVVSDVTLLETLFREHGDAIEVGHGRERKL